jgi:hypothetical protein
MNQITGSIRRDARGDVAVFVALVFALSLALYLPIFLRGTAVTEQPGLIVTLMWTPALAAVGTRLIRRNASPVQPARSALGALGFGGPGRRPAVIRAVGAAILLPLVTGAIAYGVTWTTGLAEFVTMTPGVRPITSLLNEIVRALTLGVIPGIVIVAGEEWGWRWFLAPRLRDSGIPHPLLFGGIIWATWHAPLIASGQYAAGGGPVIAVAAFTVLAIALHALWSHWVETTGSLWPALIGHSAWNTIIQFPFDGHTAGEHAALWIGDSGVIVAFVCAALVGAWLLPVRHRRGDTL